MPPHVQSFIAEEDIEESGKGKSSLSRGTLPKEAVEHLKNWLFVHFQHPYPSEDEKTQLAQETSLTLTQVNNWFINARRRLWKPIIEKQTQNTTGQPTMVNLKTVRTIKEEDIVSSSSNTSPRTLQENPAKFESFTNLQLPNKVNLLQDISSLMTVNSELTDKIESLSNWMCKLSEKLMDNQILNAKLLEPMKRYGMDKYLDMVRIEEQDSSTGQPYFHSVEGKAYIDAIFPEVQCQQVLLPFSAALPTPKREVQLIDPIVETPSRKKRK